MKKFLTVLLALSVVFTYSFSAVGTVFAAENTTAEYLQNVAKAEAQALNNLAKEYDLAKATVTHADKRGTVVTTTGEDGQTTTSTGTYQIAGAEWLKQLDAVYEAAKKDIHAETVVLQSGAVSDATVEELVAEYPVKLAADLTATLYADEGKYAVAAAKAQFAADKAGLIACANSVDTAIYSTKAQANAYKDVVYGDKTVTTKVPKEYADAIVAKAVYEMGEIKLAGTEVNATEIGLLEASVEAKLAEYIKYVEATKTYVLDENTTAVGDILTVVEEKQQDAQEAADKAALLAELAVKISDATVATANMNAEQVAAWTALKDAYNKACTYLINAGKVARDAVPDFPAYTITKTNGVTKADESATSYQTAVADMEAVAAFAEALKVKKTVDGDPAYDAAKVDEILDGLYVAQYKLAKEGTTAGITATEATFVAAKLEYSTAFAKAQKKAVVAKKVNADDMKYDSNAYYELEWADVVKAVAAYNTAIDAAATTADITKADTDLTNAIAAIKTASAVNTLYDSGVCKASAEAAMTLATNYIATLNAGKADADTIENPFANQAALNKWFAEKGARTDAEVKALYATLTAEIAKTPTKAAAAAASDAAVANVKAMIDKLPTALNATLADAEAAAAAKKALEELTNDEQAKIPAEKAKLLALVSNLEALYNAEIKAKIAEATKGGITVADAAIFDELKKLNDDYKALNGSDNSNYTSFIAANEATLRSAELNAVVEAIKAIPTNVTLKDKAVVEAARKAYDDFVAKYTDYIKGYEAAKQVANVDALLMAEAVVKTLEIKEVESLKITAKSTAAKGSITVKWTVKGDATAADGYQVFRSVKKNSGYTNKAFYTTNKNTKTSYKNTKSLKKGTRYYYKVRAYKVLDDGTKVYSDWSNKAYRIAK